MRTQKLTVRGLQCHVQEWGDDSLPTLFMLHGWMDCGATFKYMMPKLSDHFHVIAPDLRGFGESEHASDGYWFPDYYADIEVIFNHFATHGKVDVVGHSMGGNIALAYAGIRPQRVGRVLSLEAIGVLHSEPKDTADKYRLWIDQVSRDDPPKVYPSRQLLKQSIGRGNPSLSEAVVDDLISMWGKPVDDESGAMVLKHDHRHRQTNPIRYHYEDMQAVWREAQAQVGIVMAAESRIYTEFGVKGRLKEACDALRVAPEHVYIVENANHMLHLEQPEATAECILDFFA